MDDQHAREKLQYSIDLLQQSCFTASSNIHFIVTQLSCHSEPDIGLVKRSHYYCRTIGTYFCH